MNERLNHVVANLVATYDISPANTQSADSVDYLCVYEYEYDGKKYKYRTHQKGNFSPVSETIELGFGKNPAKAYKVDTSSKSNDVKASSGINFYALVGIGLIIVIYIIYRIIKGLLEVEFNIPVLVIFIFGMFLLYKKIFQIQKERENQDAMIEDAILNNRTVNAYLTKTRRRSWSNEESSYLTVHYKMYPYEGKYTYTYNGKKYKKTFEFSEYPPNSIRLFFHKNPKDVFHYTE